MEIRKLSVPELTVQQILSLLEITQATAPRRPDWQVLRRELARFQLLGLYDGDTLAGYAQIDPLKEYKKLGFEMFESMIEEMKCDAARLIFIAQVNMKREQVAKVTGTSGDGTVQRKPIVKKNKVGRNDPCPCGSGKKYKHCCGR